MADYDNTNTGILYRNHEKDEDHPNWPDYKGTLNADGVEYWLSGWIKEGKEGGKLAGQKFVSISVKAKDAPPMSQPAQDAGDDEDLPF